MALLRALSKRPPSPEAGEGSLVEAESPRNRLRQLSQDIFLEEERHQRAMMAMESSVLGCGSDDWSVDSDYAFQDFNDDGQPGPNPQSASPERAHRVTAGARNMGRSTARGGRGATNPEEEVEEEASNANVRAVTPRREEARSLPREDSVSEGKADAAGSARDEQQHPCAPGARPFGDPGSSTDSTHILRLEQRMFLKAAFQLLEERDRLFPAPIVFEQGDGGEGLAGDDRDDKRRGGSGRGETADGTVDAGEGRGFQEHGQCTRIFKSGALRKATARSMGRLETTTWKTKYIEVTPGKFAYADGSSVLGKSRNAKVIPLHLGFCTCRSLRNKDVSVNSKGSGGLAYSSNLSARSAGAGASGGGGIDGGGGGGGGGGGNKYLLEIEVVGSKRRVWAAESKQECRRWVNAIKSAMTERPVDPTETAMGENQIPTIPPDSCYRHHMESYLSARASLRTASSIEEYLSVLDDLRADVGHGDDLGQVGGEENSLGVPVKWVKQQLPGAERVYQVGGRHRGKSELAQLWKDMKRDTVSINGRVLKGERGPEAIVGALTRCILAQAGRLPASESLSKLSEAQSLLAARDVLLACDRTTSGGDTYLVVDNLCRNPDLVVLVPASKEAEPLVIQVTLHPRAEAQTPPPFRGPGGVYRSTASPRSPETSSPHSPVSIGHNSPFASPTSARYTTSASPRDPSGEGGGKSGGDEAAKHGWRGRISPARPRDSNEPQRSHRAVATSDAPVTKRRGRISLPARRPRVARGGSAAGGRGARTVPAPDPSIFSSWDESRSFPTATTAEEATAATKDRCRRSRSTGGGILASFTRRRSGDLFQGARSRAGSTSPKLAGPFSARERLSSRYGGGLGWRGPSSAPGKATSRVFFTDDTKEGVQSGSSNEEDDEDGSSCRGSYIRVACTARTSYKLFSCDPQDEEQDVYAMVTGLFEQAFTISREFPTGNGRRTSSGMGSATKTEGSVAFLTFHKPCIKRDGIGNPQSIASVVAATETAALDDFPEALPGENTEDKTDSNVVDGGGGISGRGDTGAVGTTLTLPLKDSPRPVLGEREARLSDASFTSTDCRLGDLRGYGVKATTATAGSADLVEHPYGHGDHPPKPKIPEGKTGEGGEGDEYPPYDSGACSVANESAEQFGAIGALTPESIVPVPFSPASTATRSRAGSGNVSGASPTGGSVGYSAVARLCQSDKADGVDALRLEPLDIFSDEDESTR